MMIAIQLAWRNLIRNRERSVLTLLGVMLAIGSFVALVSLAEGFSRRVYDELSGRHVDLYVLPAKSMALPTGPIGTVGLSGETVPVNVVESLLQVNNVARAAGVVRETWPGKRTVMPVLRMSHAGLESFFPNMRGWSGGPLPETEVLLGQGLARVEFGNVAPTNLTVGQTEYAVNAVVSGTGFQDYAVFGSAGNETTEKTGFHEIWLQLEDRNGARGTANEILTVYPNLKVLLAEQYQAQSNEFARYAWLLQFSIALIGILIAVTASMNTMLMSTYERMKEFATLRALGASRVLMVIMVTTESVLLSLIGGGLGLCFGVLTSGVLDRAVVVLLQLPFPLARITIPLALEAFALSTMIGILGAFIPSILVWRLNLMDGLRSE